MVEDEDVTERLPWASGTEKKAAAATPKRRRRRRKMSPAGKALTAFLGGGGLILLGCAQIFEMSALVFAGATSMALGGLQVWFETRANPAVPAPNAARPKSAKPPKTKGSRGGGKPGTVKCTRTGQPAAQCGCSPRHVMTDAGVRRFKKARQVGDPIGGGKVSTTKQPRVPTTNNARPVPVGEPMRRVL